MMNEKELNTTLREKAINNGLCAKWQRDWKNDWNIDEMISKFFEGLDFFLKHRFISNQFIKDNFDIKTRRNNNILIDDSYSLINPKQALVIGNSNSTIRINRTNASTIWIADNANVKIETRNRSFVIVHALDKSKVEAIKHDMSHLVVIIHSHDSSITGNAEVKEEYNYLH